MTSAWCVCYFDPALRLHTTRLLAHWHRLTTCQQHVEDVVLHSLDALDALLQASVLRAGPHVLHPVLHFIYKSADGGVDFPLRLRCSRRRYSSSSLIDQGKRLATDTAATKSDGSWGELVVGKG